MGEHNIRPNAISPCQIRTPALQALIDDPQFDSDTLIIRFFYGIPLDGLGEPKDLVGTAVFPASDGAAMVTSVLPPEDGGDLALNAGGSPNW